MSQRKEKYARRMDELGQQLTAFAGTEQELRKRNRAQTTRELDQASRKLDRIAGDVERLRVGHNILTAILLLMAPALVFLLLAALTTLTTGAEQPTAKTAAIPVDEPVEDFENQKIEAALLSRATRIDDCTITYYCAERYAHICGTGDGITASGVPVTPGVSCAVDPDVIPLDSTVMVDYGDGELHYFVADDTGVTGNHVDLCVPTHAGALELGVTTATVYWCEEVRE